MICNLLASLTSVPTSSTAISGTENWKEYDAIYFDSGTGNSGTEHFTSMVFTSAVITGESYYPYDNFNEANVCAVFSTQISVFKWTGNEASGLGANSLKIYGIKF